MNQKDLRNPETVWYGPHACNGCGHIVIVQSREQGGRMLDAADHNHHYPNFEWKEHKCASIASTGGKARAEALSPERRRTIASKAGAARWNKKREAAKKQ